MFQPDCTGSFDIWIDFQMGSAARLAPIKR